MSANVAQGGKNSLIDVCISGDREVVTNTTSFLYDTELFGGVRIVSKRRLLCEFSVLNKARRTQDSSIQGAEIAVGFGCCIGIVGEGWATIFACLAVFDGVSDFGRVSTSIRFNTYASLRQVTLYE